MDANHLKIISSKSTNYLTVVFLFLSFVIHAQPQPTFFSQKTFIDRPITIAIGKLSYPYYFINEKEKPAGMMVDMWRLWAEKQNVKIKFIALDWSETLEQVSKGKIDIHSGLANNIERQQKFDFTKPFFTSASNIYLRRDLIGIENANQLLPYTVGVIKGSNQQSELIKKHPLLSIRVFNTGEDLYKAALNNEVLAFAGLERLSIYYDRYQEIAELFPQQKLIHYSQDDFSAATRKNNHDLLVFVNQGIAKITQKEKLALERKWFGVDKKNDTLTLAFFSDLSPFMALSPSGVPKGLFIDIWRLWAEVTGQKVQFINAQMNKGVELVRDKEIDIQVAFPESKIYSSGLLAAHQLYTVNSQVYISNKYPNITDLNEFAGKTIGLFDSSPYKEKLAHQYPNINLLYFNDYISMLNAAELGKIDAIVAAVENMKIKLLKSNLQSSFYLLDKPVYQSKVFSLVHPENIALAEIIKEGFKLIPIEKLVALENKWLSDSDKNYFASQAVQISLNEDEKRWLEQNNTINVGMVKALPPVEFVNKNGKFDGINYNILNLIEQRTGLNMHYVAYDNWNLLYQALLDKKIDMLGSIVASEDRKAEVSFSDQYWKMPWVVIHPRHIGKQANLKDFNGKKLAIIKGYYLASVFTEEHPEISLQLVDNIEDGLAAVQRGLVDGFVETMATASELLNRESLVPLMISVFDTLENDQSQFAIRKDWPELKSIINKGILSISASEKQSIYEQWFHINIETGLNKNVVMKVSAQVGVVILIIIIMIAVWNRRLYIEIKKKKLLEEKMEHMATHDALTGLANRILLKDRLSTAIKFHQRQKVKIAVLFIDLDGFKYINDTHGHDVGDELLIKIAAKLNECVRKSDTVVRFGGDEFVLLLTGLHNANEARFVAEKVLQNIQQPFELSSICTNISCSIGISMYPNDGMTETDLLKVADTMMYRAKANGKNQYIFNETR